MNTEARGLHHQYGLSSGAARINLHGLSPEESLAAPADGSSANWVLGHIVHLRRRVHALLGLEQPAGAERVEPYGRGSSRPDADTAVPLGDLLEMLDASQRAVAAALEGLPDGVLDRPRDPPDPLLGDTVGTALAFLAFHEAYHVGQLGVLRRALGKQGAIR